MILFESGNHIVIYREAGHCLRGARLAIWTDGAGNLPGCWVPIKRQGEDKPSQVQVAFADGDAQRYDIADFRPVQVRERAPGTTL